jgi:hypothetical protein
MLKENVDHLLDQRGWSLRRLACNMSIKKKRLVRGLEGGAGPDLVDRIARAFGVPRLRLTRRRSYAHGYTVLDDGSITAQSP